MRDTFVETLIDMAKENEDIELITGDLGFGVLKPYWEQLPNQFTNAGIAEQNMVSVAAGMALEGKTVFVYSIGNFPTLRCLEQIRNDCAYHNANVKIVCVGGGFAYGSLGMSHHATEDIAIMRALPGVTVMCPGDLEETRAATKAIVHQAGTCYLRLGRGGERKIHYGEGVENFEIGKANQILDGEDIVIFSTGAILNEAIDSAEKLKKNGVHASVYSFSTVKPIDKSTIRKCGERYKIIATLEEHNIIGGFGSAVAEVLAICGSDAKQVMLGVDDEYATIVGTQMFLRKYYGIDANSIFNRLLVEMNGV